jgi:hypothetical protein
MTDDLAKQLRADAEAYRQSLAAPTSHDMFTLAYQWQDKKHRHVWDLCSKIETAADRIEKLEAALQHCINALREYEMGDDRPRGPILNDDLRPWLLGAMDNAIKVLEEKND